VVKSLGLSKLLYVCTKLGANENFVKRVKDEAVNFIWNGRKPKIKYNTLIGKYNDGGLKLLDFGSMIKASMVRWVSRLADKTNSYWKSLPLKKLKTLGGIECVCENFDSGKIPQDISKFYAKVLRAWSELSYLEVKGDDLKSILKQPLWNNVFIKFTCNVKCMERLLSCNVRRVNDLWNPNTGFSWKAAVERGCSNMDWLIWMGIIRALPAPWVKTLKLNVGLQCEIEDISTIRIQIDGNMFDLNKVKTNQIYQKLVIRKFEQPTAQRRWQRILNNSEIEWSEAYSLVYSTTIDTKLRWFQYRLLMNCLYLNKDLYKFKLKDTELCSFCNKHVETIEHLFINCEVSTKLYSEISIWLKEYSIVLPELSLSLLIVGPHSSTKSSIFINFLLLLYKTYIYRAKLNGSQLEINGFKAYLKYIAFTYIFRAGVVRIIKK
jgi:hypothetical protein